MNQTRAQVAVIGGGIAGLTAAYELQRAGVDVIVLEAEPHPGGRICTITHGDFHAEAGAMVIAASETQTLSMIRDLVGEALIELEHEGADLWLGNKIVHLNNSGHCGGLFADALDQLALDPAQKSEIAIQPDANWSEAYHAFLDAVGEQTRLIEFPYQPDANPEWDELNFGDYLDRFHPALREVTDLQLKVSAAALAEEISLFWGLVTFHWNSFDRFHWIKGGLSRLPQAIAAKLSRVVYNARVREINFDGVIKADSASESLEVVAGAIVLAMPPSAVLRIAGLQLEDWKRAALQNVPYGSYMPVHLRCRTRFWSKEIPSGYLNCADTVFADLVDATRYQPGEEGILNAFIAGPEARRLVDAPDEEVMAEVFRDLERIFPGAQGEVIEAQIHRWPEAIPYFPPAFAQTLEAVRRPQGNFFFCGDYTQGAGVNDAVVSGQLAASQLLERLGRGNSAVRQ